MIRESGPVVGTDGAPVECAESLAELALAILAVDVEDPHGLDLLAEDLAADDQPVDDVDGDERLAGPAGRVDEHGQAVGRDGGPGLAVGWSCLGAATPVRDASSGR